MSVLTPKRPESDSGGPRDLVFLSYSHQDAEWAQRFAVMLKPLVRRRRVRLWIDTDLRAGQAWQAEIDAAIARSQLALLLVSSDFLASDFIMDQELPTLVEQRVPLAPVLAGACLWSYEPLLEAVQWLHDPYSDVPLSLLTDRGSRDQRLCVLSERLVGLLADPILLPTQEVLAAETAPVTVAEVPVGSRLGALMGVPVLPPGYVARAEMDELIKSVTAVDGSAGAVGVTSTLGLHGPGGIGKSVLATALARNDVIRARFPDGIYWVTVGEQANVLRTQLDLLSKLRPEGAETPHTVSEATESLRDVLIERRVLLIVDDVWTPDAAAAFRVTGARGRLVYTARNPAVFDAVGAQRYVVDVLSPEAAREVAAAVLGKRVTSLTADADRAFEQVGRVALAVALLAAAVRGGRSWYEIVAELDNGKAVFGQHPYANAFKAMQIAVDSLTDELARGLTGLAVFPPDSRIPVAAINRYWAHTREQDAAATNADVERLAAAGVLQLDNGYVTFHDLQYDYLMLRAPSIDGLHRALLDSYRVLAGGEGCNWWQLPLDEPYIGDNLAAHLRAAGEHTELTATVTDPAYIARRLSVADTYAAEADLDHAEAVEPGNPAVEWLQAWIRRHAHVLARMDLADGTKSLDLVPTIAAWLRADPAHHDYAIDPGRIAPLLPRPCLSVRWGLEPPSIAVLRVITGHSGTVRAVGWSPDGSRLLSGGDDQTLRTWDAISGRQLVLLTGHIDGIESATWSPTGERVASGGKDGTARIWDANEGTPFLALRGHSGTVNSVGWSPDGSRLVTGDDRNVRVWDAVDGTCLMTLNSDVHVSVVEGVVWSPDGSRLVSVQRSGGRTRVWDAQSGRLLSTMDRSGWVLVVAWSPDSTRLVTGGYQDKLRIWDAETGREMAAIGEREDWFRAIAWSPDGAWLAWSGQDGTGRVADPRTGRVIWSLGDPGSFIEDIAWSPDGARLAMGDGLTVRVWSPVVAQEAAERRHVGEIWSLAWSPDRSRIAAGAANGEVQVLDVRTGNLLPTPVPQFSGTLYAVAWSPDGVSLAMAGGFNEPAQVWDTRTGKSRCKLDNSTSIYDLRWSPDGLCLAGVGGQAEILIWSSRQGTIQRALSGHAGKVGRVAWSPDGAMLASGGLDQTVRLWDVRNGRQVLVLAEQSKEIWALGWSPDGSRLASGGTDGAVQVWSSRTGDLLMTLAGRGHNAWSVAWSPDGTHLASVGVDGRLIIWSVSAGSRELYLNLGPGTRVVDWTDAGIAVGGGIGVVMLDLC